ncbi:MAG TPA: pyridoxal-phosphate dependent enzyme [Syntrophorhabdales bacterium]|nr:pyridoxal-phosphate dependent enzyme [Syntrophorhabdales bacterium]
MAIIGPTFEEMLHPEKMAPDVRRRALEMKTKDPNDPINLFNITWRDGSNGIYYFVMPKELTNVDANIVVLYGKDFPTGSHKVGAAYSVLIEKELFGEVDPAKHTLVWPSTGNYGIGGAYVGCRMGFDSIVVLPEGMSKERFQQIESYGARIIKTPGSESNVKEIYDETHRLRQDPKVRILNQFEVMGNYRFHYHVTGNTIVELADVLKKQGIGNGKIAAYCSAMGSAGTIAAGDRLKQVWHDHKIVGLEPVQCPTLYNNGYGTHDIQGIGDKHVTWIHNVMNQDAIMCLDDIECKKGLQVLTNPVGKETLVKRFNIAQETVEKMSTLFGISGVCNVLGAIKTARFYGFGPNDTIVTICTDNIDRYHSVMEEMSRAYGKVDEARATAYTHIFHDQKTDWIHEGTTEMRKQWHNLKYYTWVEQQGRTLEELNAQLDPTWWAKHQETVSEIDTRLKAARGKSL